MKFMRTGGDFFPLQMPRRYSMESPAEVPPYASLSGAYRVIDWVSFSNPGTVLVSIS